jgi:hypothetical protein
MLGAMPTLVVGMLSTFLAILTHSLKAERRKPSGLSKKCRPISLIQPMR